MSTKPAKPVTAFFAEARRSFHAALLDKVLLTNKEGIPANADGNNSASIAIAKGILSRLGAEVMGARLAGQIHQPNLSALVPFASWGVGH
jgi:hypothetical protein